MWFSSFQITLSNSAWGNQMQRYHSNSIRCFFFPPPPGYTSSSRLCDWMSTLWVSLGQPNDGNFNTWAEMSPQNFTGSPSAAPIQPRVRCTKRGGGHWAVRMSIWWRTTLFFSFLFFFCFGTGAEWGPAGYAAAVGLHPRVWRLGLHWIAEEKRRHARDGEKETKRRKFFSEVSL